MTPPAPSPRTRGGRRSRALPAAAAILLGGLALPATGCGDAPRLVVSWDATRVEADLPAVVAALHARAPLAALEELDRLEAAGELPEGALHYRALALGDLGRVTDAIAAWRQELDVHPGNGRAHALLARLLIERGELEPAARHLQEARRHAPDFAIGLLLEGRLALLRDDDEGAGRSFRDFLLRDPYGAYASEAYHALAQIAARRGPENAADARRLEDLSKRLAQVHGYLASFEERLQEDPDDLEAAYGVGAAYLNLYVNLIGDRELLLQAEPAFRHVLERAPRHAPALTNLGFIRLEQKREPEAREFLQAAIEADPEFAPARINLGTLLLKTGETDAAVRELERALEVVTEPDDRTRAHLQLGHAHAQAGTREDLRTALEHYRRVLELHPDDPMQLGGVVEDLERRLGPDADPAGPDDPP